MAKLTKKQIKEIKEIAEVIFEHLCDDIPNNIGDIIDDMDQADEAYNLVIKEIKKLC